MQLLGLDFVICYGFTLMAITHRGKETPDGKEADCCESCVCIAQCTAVLPLKYHGLHGVLSAHLKCSGVSLLLDHTDCSLEYFSV